MGVNCLFKGTQRQCSSLSSNICDHILQFENLHIVQCEAGCGSISWTSHPSQFYQTSKFQYIFNIDSWAATSGNNLGHYWNWSVSLRRCLHFQKILHSCWFKLSTQLLQQQCVAEGNICGQNRHILERSCVWYLEFCVCALISPCHSGLAISAVWGLTPPDNGKHCVSSFLADHTGNTNKLCSGI